MSDDPRAFPADPRQSQYFTNLSHCAEQMARAYFLTQQIYDGDVTRESAEVWRPASSIVRAPSAYGSVFTAYASCGGAMFGAFAPDPFSALAALVCTVHTKNFELLRKLHAERDACSDSKDLTELERRIGDLESKSLQTVESIAQGFLSELGYTLAGFGDFQRLTHPMARAPYLESDMLSGGGKLPPWAHAPGEVVFRHTERKIQLQYTQKLRRDGGALVPVRGPEVFEWVAEVTIEGVVYSGTCVTQRGALAIALEQAARDARQRLVMGESLSKDLTQVLLWRDGYGYESLPDGITL